jgi:hypothetical protein
MEVPRVKTPPILEWQVVSLSGSFEEDTSEDEFPFETISAAVEKLKNIAHHGWTYQSSEGFEIKRKSAGPEESMFGQVRDKKSLEYICPEVKKNLNAIVQDYNENVDYLEQFSLLSAFYEKVQEEIRR